MGAKLYNDRQIDEPEQIQEQTSVQEPTDASNTMLDSVKDIFSGNSVHNNNATLFTHKKGLVKFNIDENIFSPNPVIFLRYGKFEEMYYKQLHDTLYAVKEQVDTSGLLSILYLYSLINKNRYPIRITSSRYVSYLPKICSVINKLFTEERLMIRTIYTMFNSEFHTEKESIS